MAYTTIDKSSLHFNTKLYTGTGSSNAITGVGFQPDWVWIKNRQSSSNHHLVDAVRGITKELRINTNNSEASDNQLITAFGSDGFTVGTSGSGNPNGENTVAWSWKLNGQGSSNTNGTINTTYTSANTTSGVSISMYEGTGSNASFGHGLSTAPEFVIIKGLDATSQWFCYFKNVGANKSSQLDNASTFSSDTVSWQNTHPTSSVVTIGNDGGTNSSGNTMLAYCFTPVKGFSAMGEYLGNGSTDGVFLYCGFKPAFVMIKRTDTTANWTMYDNKRLGFNVSNSYIYANENNAESSVSHIIDLVSNGFKCRANSSDTNSNGSPYIYIAFAEAPLVGSNNVPATAR